MHDLADLEDEHGFVEGVLPSHTIMPRVELAVIAGGQGSVQTALASGLPFIGIPLQPEQDANVAFVQRKGAARLVPQRAAGTSLLTRSAREVLADDSSARMHGACRKSLHALMGQQLPQTRLPNLSTKHAQLADAMAGNHQGPVCCVRDLAPNKHRPLERRNTFGAVWYVLSTLGKEIDKS